MKTILASAAVALLFAGPAYAQTVVGTDVGGITVESLPAEPSIEYPGSIVVGETLPETVRVYPVPKYEDYAYTVIGPRRVIVQRSTRRIVRVIE